MNHRPHRRAFALSARGWGVLVAWIALLVTAYLSGSAQLLLAAALAIALLVVAVVVGLLTRPSLAVARTFEPPVLTAGSAATVTVTVRNRAARSTAPTTWSDAVPIGSTPTGRLPRLAAVGRRGSSADVRYRIVPARRGILELGPLDVEVGDPFGLTRGHRRIPGTQTVVVAPAVVPLHDAGVGLAAGEGQAKLVQRSILGDEDDLMTREYRRGDAMRRIHWRVSARQGELMVRQEEQRAEPEVRLVVDARRGAYPDATAAAVPDARRVESETFEWVVRMVASIGVHLDAAGFDVHVLETAGQQVQALHAKGGRGDDFLASLAAMHLESSGRIAPGEASLGGAVFAVLAHPDDEVLDWLVRLRRPNERGTAFLPIGSDRALEVLGAAGWRCVLFRPDDDLASIWDAVTGAEALR